VVAQLLLGLLADLVFESVATKARSFDAEMSRYFEQRGFHSSPPEHAPIP
jgi:hypothetical protein